MTKDDDDKRKTNPFKLRPGSHEVGYGRPPVKDRFVKGQSGNPTGRPHGSRNKPAQLSAYELRGIILSEANRAIEIHERDEVVTIPMAQAVMRKIGIDAMKGRPRAQELFMKMTDKAESAAIQMYERFLETACEYKADWCDELARRAREGQTHLPDPLPHPDDIIINPRTGEVEIHGPMTREQEVIFEEARAQLLLFRNHVVDCEKNQNRLRNPERRRINKLMMDSAREIIAHIEAWLPAAYIARKNKAKAASQE